MGDVPVFKKSTHYKSEDFNLPLALKTIIEETIRLKMVLEKMSE